MSGGGPLAGRDAVQSVGRAVRLLDSLADADAPLTVAELAARLRLARPTVHRLVATLVDEGVLERKGAGYVLSPAVVRWAGAYLSRDAVVSAAEPFLRGLRDATGETAYLFVRRGYERVCVAKSDSPHSLRRFIEVGMSLPLHAGSAGKVLLAWLPEDDVKALFARGLPALTSRTLVDPAALSAELARVRKEGVAVSLAEREEGLASISAPVFGRDDRVLAAIGISGPLSRFSPERVGEWCQAVRQAALELGERVGARPARAAGGAGGSWP